MAQPSLALYRGFPSSPEYAWSPFVTKLEVRLRFSGLTYKNEQGRPSRGPRGKIPYLVISNGGSNSNSAPETVSDTALISEKLANDGLTKNLNGQLTATEKAQDLAIRALLEDKLFFYQIHERWEQNYYTMRAKVLGSLPYPLQVLVGRLVYRKVKTALYSQGVGRLTAEEITRFKIEVWESVNVLLTDSSRQSGPGGSDSMFFVMGGNAPTEADTTLFGFIASALVCTAAPETGKIVRSFPILVDYADRIHKHYFIDYELWG